MTTTIRADFTESLITYCAATLAGHKAGSLFCYRNHPTERWAHILDEWMEDLGHKGLAARVLCRGSYANQIYVYRPEMLRRTLDDPQVAQFLISLGYDRLDDLDHTLSQLAAHFRDKHEFPHELGVFLDYPLADVRGFIAHGGQNYLAKGYWKIYDQADRTQKRFELFKKCSQVYLRCYRAGQPVSRLTVSA